MKVGDLVKYREGLAHYMREGHVNKPVLVIGTSTGTRVEHTALVLTFEGLIQRRYQWELEVVNESR